MKFLPGQAVLGDAHGNSGMYFELTKKGSSSNSKSNSSLADILKSPLAKSLFQISGIKSVFFGKDFITITKDVDESWHTMKPLVFSKIFDFYASGKPVYEDASKTDNTSTNTTILDTDDEVVATIKELLETRIRPSVQEDGGDIFYVGFDPITGIVQVRLAGSCVGCPSSSITLRNGVEKMLKHYIPEVTGIEDMTGTDVGAEGTGNDHDECDDPTHNHNKSNKLSYAPQPVPK
jgi:Fe-S cluster biogenesis protein NfuA